MSESPQVGTVPMWTIGDRMGKALSVAGISVGEVSDYLGLSRNSVSAYINDRATPKRQTLILWAMRTGVPLEWLEDGIEPKSNPTPPSGGSRQDALAALTASKMGRNARNRRSAHTAEYVPAA